MVIPVPNELMASAVKAEVIDQSGSGTYTVEG